jgi:hypothetical protein
MRLELSQEDLLPEYAGLNLPDQAVSFQHLNSAARTALIVVGQGNFSGNVISPPLVTLVQSENS